MLKIIVPGQELWDRKKEEFYTTGDVELHLEHSLISLSKWESIYHKPFLNRTSKTPEEILGYIKAMIIEEDYPEDVFSRFTKENFDAINDYIDSPQSATTFGTMPEHGARGETVTSELIYYWLVAFTIPFECENWHLNRLFSLIRICNIKNNPKKNRLSRQELAHRNRELNAKRRAELGTTG